MPFSPVVAKIVWLVRLLNFFHSYLFYGIIMPSVLYSVDVKSIQRFADEEIVSESGSRFGCGVLS